MKEKMYSIAIRKRLNSNDHFWFHEDYEFQECQLDTCNGRYWFADPFLYEKDQKVYLFYEAYDLVEKKGKEGYSILNADGTWTSPKIIIDEPYHLSFPNIFDYAGNIYIMPEMSGDYSLKLYKAESFPDIWQVSDIVLADVYACDSVFIETKEKRYLLTNEMFHNVPNGQYSSCWVKNYLYEMDGLKAVEDGTRVAEGDYGVRNAGKVFFHKEKLYRVGQDCRNKRYGRGMVLYEIESLKPYRENIVNHWDCEELSKHIIIKDDGSLVGTHTYNFSEHFETIDFSKFSTVSPYVKKERHKQRILNILNRIKNKFV